MPSHRLAFVILPPAQKDTLAGGPRPSATALAFTIAGPIAVITVAPGTSWQTWLGSATMYTCVCARGGARPQRPPPCSGHAARRRRRAPAPARAPPPRRYPPRRSPAAPGAAAGAASMRRRRRAHENAVRPRSGRLCSRRLAARRRAPPSCERPRARRPGAAAQRLQRRHRGAAGRARAPASGAGDRRAGRGADARLVLGRAAAERHQRAGLVRHHAQALCALQAQERLRARRPLCARAPALCARARRGRRAAHNPARSGARCLPVARWARPRRAGAGCAPASPRLEGPPAGVPPRACPEARGARALGPGSLQLRARENI